MGIHQVLGFDFKKLTFYYGLDRIHYPTAKDVFQFRIDRGHTFIKDYIDNDWINEPLKNGFLCYSASFMIVFDIISRQKEDGWYVVWEEDCALNILYSGFLDICRRAAPPNAEILFLSGVQMLRADDLSPRFAERKIMPGYPHFYVGQQGMGCAKCTAVTPRGARQILDLEQKYFPLMYESLVYKKANKFEKAYTVTFRVTQGVSCTPIVSAAAETDNPDFIKRKGIVNQILDSTGKIIE